MGVKNAMMKALQEVVGKAGSNMSEASKNSILALIDQDNSDQRGMLMRSRSNSLSPFANFVFFSCRCCGHHERQVAWCSCEGSPTCDSWSADQVSRSLREVMVDVGRCDVANILCFLRNRVLTAQATHGSVLGLNALLVDSPSSLLENFGDETHATICQNVKNQDVRFKSLISAVFFTFLQTGC